MQFRSAIKIRIGCAGWERFDNEIDDITTLLLILATPSLCPINWKPNHFYRMVCFHRFRLLITDVLGERKPCSVAYRHVHESSQTHFSILHPHIFHFLQKWHKGWCNWFALSYGAPFVVYLSLSSDPHVSFVPK